MANPNIVAVSNIYGKTVYDADIATSASELLENASSSGKILKINSLIIANIDGTNAADITVTLRTAVGSLLSTIAKTVSVPADATLVVISKDSSIYLEENMAIYVQASAAGDLSATCSYDEIS
tara:strand:+ start:4403 stop:4771 length:369 start_codon:yes stop_codon:yes gene_type:complete